MDASELRTPPEPVRAPTAGMPGRSAAQIRRDILALNDRLLDLVKAKHQPRQLPVTPPPTPRASSREATTRRSRAS